MPHENGFNKIKNSYVKRVLYSIYDNYGINMNETRIIDAWCYTTFYDVIKLQRLQRAFFPTILYNGQPLGLNILKEKVLKKLGKSVRPYMSIFLLPKFKQD